MQAELLRRQCNSDRPLQTPLIIALADRAKIVCFGFIALRATGALFVTAKGASHLVTLMEIIRCLTINL